jgi:hypothetical protein
LQHAFSLWLCDNAHRMTSYKIKVHISGQHDFEAEGDKETVERQFAIFTELVRAVMSRNNCMPENEPEFLTKVIRTDEKILFLSTVPTTSYPAADALLVLLLAYKLMIKRDVVSGKELLDSLKKTGVDTNRIDRAFGRYLGGTQAFVVKIGIRRGVKYKLTERGMSKARELARILS